MHTVHETHKTCSRDIVYGKTMLPSQCENAADAVFSTPHSCLTTLCPTHCSPAHTNVSAPAHIRPKH